MNQADNRITIQAAMRAAFPAFEARVAQFYAMQEYPLGWRDEQLAPANVDPGKLLRPQLTLLGLPGRWRRPNPSPAIGRWHPAAARFHAGSR